MMRLGKFLVLILLLTGCGGGGQVPIINKSPARVIPKIYTVAVNDNFYSIIWQFGLDAEAVAKQNNLRKPYKLNPGQKLRLPANKTNKVVVAKITKQPQPKKPAVGDKKPKIITPAKSKPQVAPRAWHWPAKGRVISKFSSANGQNGISIAAPAGAGVRATAAGEVVYAGNGLRGYGNLVIVKHSPEFLSAYAHNRKILVREGERVAAQQTIAQVGDSGANRVKLHFEIRKNGKPIDPLRLLN